MASWKEYKKTYRNEPELYDFARSGDFVGLVGLLSDDRSIDLDAKNHRGYSALMLGVYNGEKDCCEALLRCGADVNSTDSIGNTVLMAASFKGDLSIVELLLRFGADTNRTNQANMNARDWAVMYGRSVVVDHYDQYFPEVESASRSKSIIRFIKLSFLMIQKQLSAKLRQSD
ncbi:ankyrin repeat domain-containing protein [Vibrio hannami]|uniref:ankyrin repeat domain-containing protein n=1 Tax=Vibrio hannami TaxID=2717094 RepID=UPI002410AF7E|nr:ankyrin repeat domain-containing protein [Vibrio hannami]MDG3085899.1 ankyrin repeat domain-containing protein [Vibrio hannami]